MSNLLNGFLQFILADNITTTSIALFVALSFNTIITSISTGVISPSLSYFSKARKPFSIAPIFSNTFLFILTGIFVYFLLIIPLNQLTKDLNLIKNVRCPYCMSMINENASKCPSCTSTIQKS